MLGETELALGHRLHELLRIFAKAPARQSTLVVTLRAKTGGKGFPKLRFGSSSRASLLTDMLRAPPVEQDSHPLIGSGILLAQICGGKGIRTPDLLIANETLYQLSYTPEIGERLSRRSQFSSSIVRFAGPFSKTGE